MARISKRELFELLGYRPHPGQVQVHRSTARRRLVICGARWGKSTLAVYECIAYLLAPRPQALGWVVAPSHELAARIFEHVVRIMKLRLPHRVIESDPRERKLVVLNLAGGHAELRSRSADNPDSLLGEGLDWLIVDEAARLNERIWTSHLSQRLVDRDGSALIISTPLRKDWLYRLFRRAQKGEDQDLETWRFPSVSNPHLDAALIEAERVRLAAAVFEQEYEAKFPDEDPPPCTVCGGPQVGRNPSIISWVKNPPRCAACGDLVDESGRSLIPGDANGRPLYYSFICLWNERYPGLEDPVTRAEAHRQLVKDLGLVTDPAPEPSWVADVPRAEPT